MGFAEARNEKMTIETTICANLTNLTASLETFLVLSKTKFLTKFTLALFLLSIDGDFYG